MTDEYSNMRLVSVSMLPTGTSISQMASKQILQGFQAPPLSRPAEVSQANDADVVIYTPFVEGAEGNLGSSKDAHDLVYVMKACEIAINLGLRTNKAYRRAISAVYVFACNANRFFLADLVMNELGEKLSEKRKFTQLIRILFNLKNVPAATSEVAAENDRRNNAVSRAHQKILDIHTHFKHCQPRIEDTHLVYDYLTSRDKAAGRNGAALMAAILSEPEATSSVDDAEGVGDAADGEDADENGAPEIADGEGGPDKNQGTDDDTSGDGDNHTDDHQGSSVPDGEGGGVECGSDSEDNGDHGSADDNEGPASDDAGEAGSDEPRGSTPANGHSAPSIPEISTAKRMLIGAHPNSVGNLLVHIRQPGEFVAVCYRIEHDESETAVSAIGCDEALISKFYRSAKDRSYNSALTLFGGLLQLVNILKTMPKATLSSSGAASVAHPAVLVTVGPGGVVQGVHASDADTLGTVMISITPTVEVLIPCAAPGQYISQFDWHAAPSRESCRDAFLRFDNAAGGFTATFTFERGPDVVIPFRPYGESDARIAVPANRSDFPTGVVMVPVQFRNFVNTAATPFLNTDPAQRRQGLVLVSAHESGGLYINNETTGRSAVVSGEFNSDDGGAIFLFAEDLFLTVASLGMIVFSDPVSFDIDGDESLRITAETGTGIITVVIPAACKETLERVTDYSEPLAPALRFQQLTCEGTADDEEKAPLILEL